MISPAPDMLGIYIHWPFCVSKCPYCDFNVHVRESIDEARWAQNYVRALQYYAERTADKSIVNSIYFGGGTPSLMPPSMVGAIIDCVQKHWRISNDVEITLEANPTTVEVERFQGFKSFGVNRVSLGVQALSDSVLQFFGRAHDKAQALKAIEAARTVFDRYNFDLIYARPDQSLKEWDAELREALTLIDGHVSLYQLTIERNTPFYFDHARGRFQMPEDGLAADFYDLTQDIMEAHGLPAYEVSNHAAVGEESRHNLNYWRYNPYVGVGPGAHGRVLLGGNRVATRDHQAPDIWLDWVEEKGCGAHPFAGLSVEDQFFEGLMMGLRLRDGLDLEALAMRVGAPNWRVFMNADKLDTCIGEGWLSLHEGHLIATRAGWLRLNAILGYIVK